MAKTKRKKVSDDYLALIGQFALKELRSGEELEAALGMLQRLMIKPEESLSPGEADYLGALSLLVRAYEERRRPADRRSPLERLKFLMETSGMSRSALGDVIGSRPAASMILRGGAGNE